MTLSFSQWVKLGFGGMAWLNKHRAAVDDAITLWQSVVPPEAEPAKDGLSHTNVVEKIRTGTLSADEKQHLDRATQDFGAG